jgi:hypothetical protein
MGNLLGSRQITSCLGVSASCLLLLAASCGSGDESENPFAAGAGAEAESTLPRDEEAPGLQPCEGDRHVVAFDVAGLLMVESDPGVILNGWNTGEPPAFRPGTPEVAVAYRELGYEVIYMVGLPPNVTLGGAPAPQALEAWLGEHAYPTGVGVHYWFWDPAADGGTNVWTAISNELLRLAGEGASIDAGYTDNPERAYGMATGGVLPDRLFTLESIPVEGVVIKDGFPPGPRSTPLAGDDFLAHLDAVEALGPVCLTG